MFIDDFTEFMSDIQKQRMNNYIPGDFNLHICYAEDKDTQVFEDTLEAVGLVQYVGFSTHQCGNILDLIITEVGGKVDIIRCTTGQIISDHKAVNSKNWITEGKIRSVKSYAQGKLPKSHHTNSMKTPEKKINLKKKNTMA